MDGNVLAAARDELLAAMHDHEGEIGEAAFQGREFDRACQQASLATFSSSSVIFLPHRGEVIISRDTVARYVAERCCLLRHTGKGTRRAGEGKAPFQIHHDQLS